jgi:hypothetical protein
VVAGVGVRLLRVEVGDVVRAAELEAKDVVDLERRPGAARCECVLDLDLVLSESGMLRIVLVRKVEAQMTRVVSLE